MKKLLLSVVFSVLYVTSASAELGVNVGFSGNAGLFAASAHEKHTNTNGKLMRVLSMVLLVGVQFSLKKH